MSPPQSKTESNELIHSSTQLRFSFLSRLGLVKTNQNRTKQTGKHKHRNPIKNKRTTATTNIKVKKKNIQTEHSEKKIPQNMPLSFFSDGHLLLGMGPALKSDLYTQ